MLHACYATMAALCKENMAGHHMRVWELPTCLGLLYVVNLSQSHTWLPRLHEIAVPSPLPVHPACTHAVAVEGEKTRLPLTLTHCPHSALHSSIAYSYKHARPQLAQHLRVTLLSWTGRRHQAALVAEQERWTDMPTVPASADNDCPSRTKDTGGRSRLETSALLAYCAM